MMDPQIAVAMILVLCLALVILAYVLGIEVGRTLETKIATSPPPTNAT